MADGLRKPPHLTELRSICRSLSRADDDRFGSTADDRRTYGERPLSGGNRTSAVDFLNSTAAKPAFARRADAEAQPLLRRLIDMRRHRLRYSNQRIVGHMRRTSHYRPAKLSNDVRRPHRPMNSAAMREFSEQYKAR